MAASPRRLALPMQHDSVATSGARLAVGSSALGGNDWGGAVTFFAHEFEQCEGAVHLPGGVPAVAWMEDRLVAACDDGEARVLAQHAVSGTWSVVASVAEHDDLCAGVACAGSAVVTAGWDGACYLFDLSDGRSDSIATLRHADPFSAVAWASPSLVVALADHVVLWDTRSSEPARKRAFASKPTSVNCLGDIVVGFANGDVMRIDDGKDTLLRRHAAKVGAIALSDTGELLSASDDGIVYGLGQHTDYCRAACFWNNRPLTAGWDGNLTLWR